MFGFIGHVVHSVVHAVTHVVHAVSHFVSHHWKQIAVIAASTVVFIAVTAATGGLGAPALLAIAAGGFASGAAGYTLSSRLYGTPFSWKGLAFQSVLGAGIGVATFGVGRFATPFLEDATPLVNGLIPDAVPQVVRVAGAYSAAGAAFGAGSQVASNAIEGRALDTNLGDATLTGAATGAVMGPALDAAAEFRAPSTTPAEDAAPLIARSPTLQNDIATLERDGWTIRYGEPFKGTYANRTTQEIVLDPADRGFALLGGRGSMEAEVANSLAHETGHAAGVTPTYTPPWQAGSRESYVETNVRENLNDEGQASYNEGVVRSEILANGGPDIGGSAATRAGAKIFENQDLTPEERIVALADMYGGFHPSTEGFWKLLTGRARTYVQYYGEPYEKYWDDNAPAPPAQTEGIAGALGALGK